jgi:uncharacterized protein (TIGR02147 family)
MKQSIFFYEDYKRYLNDLFRTSKSPQAKLAQALGCGTSFVSQVLKGSSHFSLEQATRIGRHLGHADDEQHYFMLLLQRARAGSVDLASYFTRQMEKIRSQQQVIQERIGVKKTLNLEDQANYYGAWTYAAIHIALSIPRLQTLDALARGLGVPRATVSEVLKFLVGAGLAIKERDRYRIGNNRIHLGRDSPLLTQHHINWRLRAMQSLVKRDPDHLHFSSVMGIAKADAPRIKAALLSAIEETEKVVQETSEEALYCLSLDFFSAEERETH